MFEGGMKHAAQVDTNNRDTTADVVDGREVTFPLSGTIQVQEMQETL